MIEVATATSTATANERPSDIAAAAEAERKRIRAIEALGHEFGLLNVARVLCCETSEPVEGCRRILSLLIKAGADQKARESLGWNDAYERANQIAGYEPRPKALSGTAESAWEKVIAAVNEQSGVGASSRIHMSRQQGDR